MINRNYVINHYFTDLLVLNKTDKKLLQEIFTRNIKNKKKCSHRYKPFSWDYKDNLSESSTFLNILYAISFYLSILSIHVLMSIKNEHILSIISLSIISVERI